METAEIDGRMETVEIDGPKEGPDGAATENRGTKHEGMKTVYGGGRLLVAGLMRAIQFATRREDKKMEHTSTGTMEVTEIDGPKEGPSGAAAEDGGTERKRTKVAYRGIGRMLVVGLISVIFPAVFFRNQQSLMEQYRYDNGPPDDRNDSDRARNQRGTVPEPVTTLVHYDPFFKGGFRNQHMRFVAFVAFANRHNITQLLLPSLRWSDPYNMPRSVPHKLLFDVAYWNSRAGKLDLPRLVDYDPGVLEGFLPSANQSASMPPPVVSCWNITSGLYSGLDEAHLRHPDTNLRRTNIWEMIGQGERYSHCRRTPGPAGENSLERIREIARSSSSTRAHRFTHLIPHGGTMSAGKLWWEYEGLQQGRGKASVQTSINGEMVSIHPEHVPVERAVYEAMRPGTALRRGGEASIEEAIGNATDTGGGRPRVLALHPRVEQEMLTHKCAKYMESSLSTVFSWLAHYPTFWRRFDLAFLAVSRSEIERAPTGLAHLHDVMARNRDALLDARAHGVLNRTVPVFESGIESAWRVRWPRGKSEAETEKYDTPQSLGVSELVASIINFFVAVDAEVFVGVRGSTYSTDAMSVRYYQKKAQGGKENYIVGREGLRRWYGPAPPHTCD